MVQGVLLLKGWREEKLPMVTFVLSVLVPIMAIRIFLAKKIV